MSQASSITVAVRVRPPTSSEQDRLPDPPGWNDTLFIGDGSLASPRKGVCKSLRPVVQVMDDHVLIFDPKDPDTSRSFEQRGFLPPGAKRYKDQRYTFDRVFDENAQQIDVYEKTTKPLLDGLLDGFNATVFAYGATGCGKTHTISGTEADPGIIYLTMAELFTKIDERRDENIIEVSLSFLEIYNEEIRDLLVEPGSAIVRGGLAMREDKSNRIIVSNLTELRPATAEEVKAMVLIGNARRTQSPTHANETSSRSHAVLQINVAQTPRTAGTTEERTMATLSIIDLAGSERASATKNMGERMVEGANINKSLLSLGNCINALCESGNKTRHVPYRNSKLTRLLKFSLGGNCKTVMIVCVAPTSAHFEDTQNTLKYANRAKDIKTKVSRNFINVDRHVAQYVEAINRLNCEVAELKAKLAGKIGGESDVAKRRKAEGKAEMERTRVDLRNKVEQTRPVIVDGGICEANISAAAVRLDAVRARIGQLEAQAAGGALMSDLQAELELLRSLAAPDEAALKTSSELQRRLSKSNNANSLFDAMIRAVSERRSDRMDDVMTDSIKVEAKFRRVELDHTKVQAKESVLKEALCQQAGTAANLVGMLARCTVMMRDGALALQRTSDELTTPAEREGAAQNVQAIAASLLKVAESNDKTFRTLVGQTTAASTAGGHSSSLFSFTSHTTRSGVSRRSSVAGNNVIVKQRRRSSMAPPVAPSPARRHRSPRKQSALRQSLSIQPQLLFPRQSVSTDSSSNPVEKKALRWKDEVGDGSLDDGGKRPSSSASNAVSSSENDWEDEVEKTDDSGVDSSNESLESSTSSNATVVTAQQKTSVLGVPPVRKPRGPRFESNLLKPHGAGLGSLTEVDDESLRSPSRPSTRDALGERSNRPLDGTPPRPDNKHTIGPQRMPGSARKKRLSVGPLRMDKPRRRSSLIPQLSPQGANGSSRAGSNRLKESTRSPMKKARRLSASGGARASLSIGGSGSSTSASSTAKRPWRPSLSVRLTPIMSSPSDSSATSGSKARTWR